jgi:hypothetical protein
MPYGSIKVDNIIFTNGGVDQTITVSGIVASTSGNLTATGTISGNIIRGGTTVSGATVTGSAGQFGNLTAVSGTFTTISGGTYTLTSGVFASGTAANPSISFVSDPDTGIYSPGANQVAISTSGTGRLFIDSSGRLLVNTSTARANYNGYAGSAPKFQIEGSFYLDGSASFISNSSIFNSWGPHIAFGRSRSGSIGSNTIVQNGDYTGTIVFHGNDGTNFIESARIDALVDGTPGANDMPGRLVFSTTADGSSSPSIRMRISNAGTTTLTSAGSTAPFIANISTTEVARIDSSGRLLVGTSSARGIGTSALWQMQVEGTGAQLPGISLTQNANDAEAAYLAFGKSRGTFVGSNTVVQSGDRLGQIVFAGSDGTDLETRGAEITCFVDGTPGTDDMPGRLVFSTTADGASSPTERMRITNAGLVGLGTSVPSSLLHLVSSGQPTITIADDGGRKTELRAPDSSANPGFVGTTTNHDLLLQAGTTAGGLNVMRFNTAGAERVRITDTGAVGIGSTNPLYKAQIEGSSSTVYSGSARNTLLGIYNPDTTSGVYAGIELQAAGVGNASLANISAIDAGSGSTDLAFGLRNSNTFEEKARITSAGRLGIGTSSPTDTNGFGQCIDIRSSTGAAIYLRDSDDTTNDTFLIGRDNADSYLISNSGNILFSNAGSERMRIDDIGRVLVATTTINPAFNNVQGGQFGALVEASNDDISGRFNRRTTDGTIIEFRQDGTLEGSISVSGTTVSYNGAHLSRWSQLPGGATREEILRGTVLSNIDEMCEWGEEDNEQLNRMKVSDVEGDPNVAGVFQCWDDDDTYTDDFYCAMMGDFIIRIAAGVTVQRGQLLMSAGDGTAKPQGDDIVRSKTIAKVTSNHITCTYDDGSYCVPCVLMAC